MIRSGTLLERTTMHRSGIALAVALAAFAGTAAAEDTIDNWPSIRDALFPGKVLEDGAGVLALEAPARAEDAAVVPVTIKALLPQTQGRYVKALHLIIDNNPAPVAGVFHLFPESGSATISTRVRVNAYTNLHAVAETSDGGLYVVERFIKASGGCSAPALKDKEAALARLGRMQLKPITPFAPGTVNEAQLLVSHPNYTGLQIDQLTRNWIAPDYVRSIKVRYGDKPVLEVAGDISLSEDPAVTFSFVPTAPAAMTVEVEDSKGRRFERSWPVGPSS
jgi:sulfur-oxidizing protein SoxY